MIDKLSSDPYMLSIIKAEKHYINLPVKVTILNMVFINSVYNLVENYKDYNHVSIVSYFFLI